MRDSLEPNKDPFLHSDHEFEDLDFEEHEEHVDEKWLVSYADMMTLMFGLFVLLFAMNQMDKAEVEKIKKSASEQFGASEATNDQLPEVSEKKLLDHQMLIQELQDKQVEIDELKETLIGFESRTQQMDQLKVSLARVQGENSDLLAQLNSLKLDPSPKSQTKVIRIDPNPDLQAEIQNLKLQLELASTPANEIKSPGNSDKYKSQIRKLLALQSRLKKELAEARSSAAEANRSLASASDQSEKIRSLAQERLRLQSENQKLKNSFSSLKSKALSFRSSSKQSEKEIEDLKANLRKTQESLTKKIAELQSQVGRSLASTSDASKTISQLEAAKMKANQENKKLKDLLLNAKESTKATAAKATLVQEKLKSVESLYAQALENRSFLAVLMKWPTRDHDIDLVIEDPNGQKYDFKKKGDRHLAGRFALDTKRGPGAELWLSDQVIPGKYKATYYFFNQYGNINPTQVSATIYTPKGQVEVKPKDLDISKNRSVDIYFNVSKEGKVSLFTPN